MKKIRVIFILCSLFIAVLAFFWLTKPDFSIQTKAGQEDFSANGFHLTGISEKGNLFVNNNEALRADVKTTDFSREIRLRSDDLTAWEFFFEGVLFTVLPGGSIQYTPQTRELILENGEFYWQKQLHRQNIDISLFQAGNILRLSDSGRMRLKNKSLEIWNYSGQIDFDYTGKAHRLQSMQFFKTLGNGKFSGAICCRRRRPSRPKRKWSRRYTSTIPSCSSNGKTFAAPTVIF